MLGHGRRAQSEEKFKSLIEEARRHNTDLPIWFALDSVEVFSALLAIVFIWTHCLVHDPHTASVLPDFAIIALNEHAAHIVGQQVR